MTWLTWRLQRTEFLLLGAMLAGLSGLLLWTQGDVAAIARVTECANPFADPRQGCGVDPSPIYDLVFQGLPWLNFLPLVAALLLALPLVTELEHGTYRLAWTQGRTRGEWARNRLGLLALAAAGFAGVFTLAFRWWSGPLDRVYGRLGEDTYDFGGTLPVAHTLFAAGLMLAVGVVMRRTVPAVVLAGVAYVAIRIPFMLWVRPRLRTPVTMVDAPPTAGSAPGDWQLTWSWRDAAGADVGANGFFALCGPTRVLSPEAAQECARSHGLVQVLTYHPDAHYWPLQLTETAIFVTAAAALVGFAGWWVMRRVE